MSGPRCPICLETFTRQEHVDRHVRSHTNEKPFKCTTCLKAFSRRDLLTRHEKGHAPDASDGAKTSTRVQAACLNCAASKQKCSGEQSCSRCAQKSVACIFPENPGGRRKVSRISMSQTSVVDEGLGTSTIALAEHNISSAKQLDNLWSAETNIDTEDYNPVSNQLQQQQEIMGMNNTPIYAAQREVRTALDAQYGAPPTQALPNMQGNHIMPIDQSMSPYMASADMFNAGMPGINGNFQNLSVFNHNLNADMNTFLMNLFEEGSRFNATSSFGYTELESSQSVSSKMDMEAQYYPIAVTPPTQTPPTHNYSNSLAGAPYQQNLYSHSTHARTSLPPIRNALLARTMEGPKSSENTTPAQPTPFSRNSMTWMPSLKDTHAEILSLAPACEPVQGYKLPKIQAMFRSPINGVPELTAESREQIVLVLTKAQVKGPWPEIDLAFPDLEFFQNMLDNYFAYTHPQYPLIHVGTFDPNTAPTILTAAMIATGTMFSAGLVKDADLNKTVQKDFHASIQNIGFGLSELVRRANSIVMECDTSSIRNLEILQANLIIYLAGTFSGRPRPREISEAFSYTLVTMVRRSDWSRSYFYPTLRSCVYGKDQQLSLDLRWKAWLKHEIKKRLVYALFVWTTQIGSLYQTLPLMSPYELTLPLLHSDRLWDCKDANSWFELARQEALGDQEEPSFATFASRFLSFDSAEILTCPSSSNSFLLRLALLGVVRGVICEHQQMQHALDVATFQSGLTSVNRRKRKRQNAQGPSGRNRMASMAQRHAELLELLDSCEDVLLEEENDHGRHQGENSFVLITLHQFAIELHCSLLSLLKLAGREDISEAKRALPSLLRWIDSEDSRQCIWHAGQIMRLARRSVKQNRASVMSKVIHVLPSCISFAGMTLWAYGILESMSLLGGHASPPLDGQPESLPPYVYLDQTKNDHVTAFIKLGQGIPVLGPISTSSIGQGEGVFTLDRPRDIMDTLEVLMNAIDPGGGAVALFIDHGRKLGNSGKNLIRSYRSLKKNN